MFSLVRTRQIEVAMIRSILLCTILFFCIPFSFANADPQGDIAGIPAASDETSLLEDSDAFEIAGKAVETNCAENETTGSLATSDSPDTAKDATVGKWSKVAGNKWKFITAEGPLIGFHRIADKTYYFDSDGIMKTGWLAQRSDWYYFAGSGAMKTGWLKTGGKWYYLNPSDGKMLTGKQTVGNATYFLTSSGAMKTGWNLEDGTWYHYKSSGAMTTGWLKSGGKWYYLDPSNGAMKTGKYDVGGSWYISNDSGAMYANKWVQLSEGWYYATSSGALKTGWLKSGGKWYWLQADKDCLMIADTMATIDDVLYSFTSSGAMQANCQVRLDGDACGYAASSGAITKIGVFSGSNVILQDANGNTLTGWQKFAGKWFYANDDGVSQTGWIAEGGEDYLFDASGVLISNNAASRRLVAAANRVPYQGNGYCAKWANYVYVNAGYGHPDGNACDLYKKYCTISDLSLMEPGMIIAVPSHTRTALGKRYGHVALYMGNGMVRHNTNKLETIPLKDWLAYYETTYKAKCGWAFY